MSRLQRGRVVVAQQPDGWWRWRFFPVSPAGDVLVSGEAYPEKEEAVESAASAYPGLHPVVEAPVVRPHRLRSCLGRVASAAAAVAVVAAAAKAGNRHPGAPR